MLLPRLWQFYFFNTLKVETCPKMCLETPDIWAKCRTNRLANFIKEVFLDKTRKPAYSESR